MNECKMENRDSIQNYKLGPLLGKGGFAKVYKASSLIDGSVVAIKIINKIMIKKTNMMEKVKDEAEIHYRLSHPSILKMYSIFEDSENVYLVLEYCRYGELGRYLQRHNRAKLTEQEACTIVRQVLEGLLYLHSYSILHRDLKLANLLLYDRNRIKIADFGLATELVHPLETHQTMCGTPNYISPEVATSSPHGLGVDIWGLGVILYTLLFGRAPFDTASVQSTLSKVVECSLEIPGSISYEARDLLCKLLRKDPSYRITAQEAIKHPFFKIYPDTPLQCNTTQDSGLGHCSMCSWSGSGNSNRQMGSRSSQADFSRSRHSQDAMASQNMRPSHSTIHTSAKFRSCHQVEPGNNSSRSLAQHPGAPNVSSRSSPGNFVPYSMSNSTSSSPARTVGSFKNSFNGQSAPIPSAVQSVIYKRIGSVGQAPSTYFDDTSGFVEYSQGEMQERIDSSSNTNKSRAKERMKLPIFSTKRLPPTRMPSGQRVFHILASGDAVLQESLERNLVRYLTVTSGFVVVQTMKWPVKLTPPAVSSAADRYPVSELPRSLHRPYNTLAVFIKRIQATTIKLTLHTDIASCRLMESSPDDFLVDFFSGETVTKHGETVTVALPKSTSREYHFNSLPSEFQWADSFRKLFEMCLRLENDLSKIPELNLFPASFGAKSIHEARKEASAQPASCNREERAVHAVRAQSTPVKPAAPHRAPSRLAYEEIARR